MGNDEQNKAVLKAGMYYVGDPWYVLFEDLWLDISYDEGCILNYNESQFWFHSTEYGDGFYFDNNDNNYSVDSGCIGIIPIDIIDSSIDVEQLMDWGTIYSMENDFVVSYDEGVFSIDDVIIDTNKMFR